MAHFGGINPIKQQQRAQTLRLALGVGIVAFFVVIGLFFLSSDSSTAVESVVREVPAEVEMVEVLVPVQSIKAGAGLEPQMFRKDPRPKQGLSPRVIRDFEEIKGFYARSLIAADAPLLSDYITSVPPSSEITPKIPDGYRAVTISVNSVSAVEGWARPGARVDVVWATVVRGHSTVKTIVQNARVLSADARSESPADQQQGGVIPSSVTLLVTAKDAQKIQLAKTSGTLSLTLRGDDDRGKASDIGTLSIDDLLEGNRTEEIAPNSEGSVIIGGVEYDVVRGKMVPRKK
ncbi:MAG: Flp pilus assembly protein CpaB [Bdellovibrionales bacterium]|nr:Flp pilus assembly protein CpaB [Bdellovibrionales bacterium]